MRSLTFLLLFFLVAPAFGQQTVDRLFEADPPLDLLTIRPVYEAVRDLDPNGKVLHSDDYTLLQLRVHPEVTEAQLRQALTNKGISLKAGTPELPVTGPATTRADGRPLYVVTDDPVGDRARYEAAVQQWNEANPADQIQLPVPMSHDQ